MSIIAFYIIFKVFSTFLLVLINFCLIDILCQNIHQYLPIYQSNQVIDIFAKTDIFILVYN